MKIGREEKLMRIGLKSLNKELDILTFTHLDLMRK